MTNPIYVDLSEVRTLEELHEVLKTALLFPDYYGGNLDALHDCLTELGSAEEPAEVVLCNYKMAKKALDGDYYRFRTVLEDSAEENPNLEVRWKRHWSGE